jgi:hypothetical protein
MAHRDKHAVPIVAGSAIIGREIEGNRVEISFEGGLFAPQWNFRQRLERAVVRLACNYPSVARAIVSKSELIEVGAWFSGKHPVNHPNFFLKSRVHISLPDELSQWTGVEDNFHDLQKQYEL